MKRKSKAQAKVSRHQSLMKREAGSVAWRVDRNILRNNFCKPGEESVVFLYVPPGIFKSGDAFFDWYEILE